METETPTIRPTADMADELAAGRPFPVRDALAPLNHRTAVEHLQDCRAWWLDAAESYQRQAEAGASGALADAWRALAASRYYAPQAVV